MFEFLAKILPAALLVGSFAFYGANGPEKSLRPWTEVGSSAYISLVNNTKFSLPIFAKAPEVDSASRFLGILTDCDSVKFKLPYVDTKVILLAGDAALEVDVKDARTYSLELNTDEPKFQCPIIRKVVAGVVDYVDPMKWRASGYSRLTDSTVPSMLVLAYDMTVCPIWQISVNPIREQEFYVCKAGWRSKQE